MTRLPIDSAEDLAYSPEFADGTWRNDQKRSLPQAIAHILGAEVAAELWRDAELLFEARHLGAAHKGLPLARNRQRNATPIPAELRLAGNRGRAL